MMGQEEAADSIEASIQDQEKCIRQFAQNVSKNVKFRSSQQKASQFFAENALQKESQDSN